MPIQFGRQSPFARRPGVDGDGFVHVHGGWILPVCSVRGP